MPKKKGRSQHPPPPPPAQDDDSLVDDLLSQLDSRDNHSVQQQESSQMTVTALPKHSAKSRFLARQARKAAALDQASAQVDPVVQARLQQGIKEEEDTIRRTCDQLGLEIFQINPDGHCLFSAIADQLSAMEIIPASSSNYHTIRRAAADYIQSHPDDFVPFLPSLDGVDVGEVMSLTDLDNYCALIRDTAEWGGEPEILALSRVYHTPIHVVQVGPPTIVKHDLEQDNSGTRDNQGIVFISYHRKMYGLGEHYNSLRRKESSLRTST